MSRLCFGRRVFLALNGSSSSSNNNKSSSARTGPSQTKTHKQLLCRSGEREGEKKKGVSIAAWPFSFRKTNSLERHAPLPSTFITASASVLKAQRSLETRFDEITSSYLQFGGGSSVISASSF